MSLSTLTRQQLEERLEAAEDRIYELTKERLEIRLDLQEQRDELRNELYAARVHLRTVVGLAKYFQELDA